MADWLNSQHTQVDLLRHGACEGGEIFRGSTDVALSEEGWNQLRLSTADLNWDQIVCSPLIRCQHFAQELSQKLDIPLHVDARWREFHFGEWEGMLRSDVWAERGEEILQFYSDPSSFTPPGGDSFEDVSKRLADAWKELIDTHQGKRVLVVTHAGIFRTIYSKLQSLPTTAFNSVEIPFACLSRWKVFHNSDESNSPDSASPLTMLSFHNRQVAGPIT
ncbi:MAG: alpha-ribazole phosphatase family protein [Porticoccaceae bacterium]|jgi:alpha-ribazole phosphatase|nr:alpha-ribazole phosphatase family protein [Porticoccaceae bacterium]